MGKTKIPAGYRPCLTLYETQNAIGIIKRTFEDQLSEKLRLKRVSAPLFVDPATGLNDNLNGVEEPVRFHVPGTGVDAEVVHSLAKWKRMALYRYGFPVGKGLYADMNAIRKDETPDNLHSIYVDQWDWEKVIADEERTEETLKETVRRIVDSICNTLDVIKKKYPQIQTCLDREVYFLTSEELLQRYPTLSPKEREDRITREHPTVFLMQIGGRLSNGEKHDGRSPDYDDWQLNGDLLFRHNVLDIPLEISSMGVRVNAESLSAQLSAANCDDRRTLTYHKMLLDGQLPECIGGGIGQSRLCMLLLGNVHVGEVQSSVWDEETLEACKAAGITLL